MADGQASTLPRRADARRNRERVLRAAREAFAEHGLGAGVEKIAARAGVGVGTVYRHFPTKEGMVEALAAEHFSALAEEARAAADESDPWRAVADFLRLAASRQAEDRALGEIMAARPEVLRQTALGRDDLYAAVGDLIRRAQEAGELRADVVPEDIPLVMCGIGNALQIANEGRAWERYLNLLLDGMRAAARPPPSGGTPAGAPGGPAA